MPVRQAERQLPCLNQLAPLAVVLGTAAMIGERVSDEWHVNEVCSDSVRREEVQR